MENTTDNCCICLDSLDSSEIKRLQCNHILHTSCLEEYNEYCIKHQKEIKCPLCIAVIGNENPTQENPTQNIITINITGLQEYRRNQERINKFNKYFYLTCITCALFGIIAFMIYAISAK